jgi:2,3-bisphosphoglycerate-independent phosphoglycerate mutase
MSESLALIVLDGWGLAPPGPGNAISQADTPVFDRLWAEYPHTQLTACGAAVGLPEGQMGNSEVGHLNLGAGSVVKQDLAMIDETVANGSFFENAALREACAQAKAGTGRLHLMGLVSDGGVHSSLTHLRALIELAAREQVPELALHAFTDGRDTGPTSSPQFLASVDAWLDEAGAKGTKAVCSSVGGRYWAMDRDRRWDRVKRAYDAIVHGDGAQASDPQEAVRRAYGLDQTDEFIQPTVIGDPVTVRDGDTVVMFNFRPDRMREITRALGEREFGEFDRGAAPTVQITTMTSYQEEWDYPVAFEPERPAVTVADLIADRGERQLHVAETEKYAHVTYFFNGGVEHEHTGERRALVDSPRDVATYDLKPEMSAQAAADEFSTRWKRAVQQGEGFRFGVINFANADMVGHTGSIPAAVAAVEAVDRCLGQVIEAIESTGGCAIVTADHGNADEMLEADGSPDTAHSLNPVPMIVTRRGVELADGGVLADVVPTALSLMGIPQPDVMTGRSLLHQP